MSVDVEDYFHVAAFADVIHRDSWHDRECRIPRNVELTLELFASASIRATFFTLGWVAERYPALIRAVAAAGHEVASHGYAHIPVTEQSPRQFLDDVRRTKRVLEDVVGTRVLGYRAASFSIGAGNLWALDVLREAGYLYSSSINPIEHDLYGMPEAPRFPFRLQNDGILEVPITTWRIWNRNLPCGGGGFFRLLPYVLFRHAVRHVNEAEGQSAVFYFHPWELDPGQPRMRGAGAKARVRHYLNLHKTQGRLERLLRDFRWDRMDAVFLPGRAGGH